MAVTVKKMAAAVAFCGTVSFILGVVAENKKPASRILIRGKGVVNCNYPSDLTVVLGYLSFAFLLATTVVGQAALFYPYNGKAIPRSALFKSTIFLVFYNIALFVTGLAAMHLLWPTMQDQRHIAHNVYFEVQTNCRTAKTCPLEPGVVLSLESSLLWLVALMLANNAREDYFDEIEEDGVVAKAQAFKDDDDARMPANSSVGSIG